MISRVTRASTATAIVGFSWVLTIAGCNKPSGGEYAGAVNAALKQAHQASVNAAEVTECALTATSKASVDRAVVLHKVDSAEMATRAATRALENALQLNDTCRDKWDQGCEQKAATVGIMMLSTKDTMDHVCAQPAPADAAAGQ
jgi:hypothetical protein